IEKVDGSMETGVFPESIAPHQPFLGMRAIAHELLPASGDAPALWANVRFEGDIFEMEDQRNWTDASYKTYCTPLALDYPLPIAKGPRVAKSVPLTREAIRPSHTPPPPVVEEREGVFAVPRSSEPLTFRRLAEGAKRPLPPIGLGVASHGQPLSARE